MPSLTDLQKSIERYILEAYAALVRADAIMAAVFNPIRIVDSPTREAFLSYPVRTLSIQPYQVRLEDFPSSRQTTHIGIMTSAFMSSENQEKDSVLLSLDLGNHLRKLAWTQGGAFVHPTLVGISLTFATVIFSQLTPIVPKEGVRILSYRTIYETDIDPVTGLLV